MTVLLPLSPFSIRIRDQDPTNTHHPQTHNSKGSGYFPKAPIFLKPRIRPLKSNQN